MIGFSAQVGVNQLASGRLVGTWIELNGYKQRVDARQQFRVIYAVVSPLLAYVYLHYAFDQWVEVWRKKLAKSDV